LGGEGPGQWSVRNPGRGDRLQLKLAWRKATGCRFRTAPARARAGAQATRGTTGCIAMAGRLLLSTRRQNQLLRI
jgi:hypothetical protein